MERKGLFAHMLYLILLGLCCSVFCVRTTVLTNALVQFERGRNAVEHRGTGLVLVAPVW